MPFFFFLAVTGKGKLSDKANLKYRKSRKNKVNETREVTYELECNVDAGFGIPGAFVIRNQHKFKFLLESMTLFVLPPDQIQTLHFESNSWVYPFHLTQKDRVFFANPVSFFFFSLSFCSFDAIKEYIYI